jgi:pyruvate dehydrogenase E2 component (dihydrolipoamide acetyltransferase)
MSDTSLVQVVMPQMGESLAEGTIVRWFKQPGDLVEQDEPLFELSTDKVDTDVPSPAAGVLHSILVTEGETVAVGAHVALIKTGESTARPEMPAPPAPAAAASEEPAGHFKSSHAPQLVSFRRDRSGGSVAAVPAGLVPAGTPVARVETPEAGPANRSFSPAVLGEVRRSGLPLDRLPDLIGTGRGGRITKRDVQRVIAEGGRGVSSPASSDDLGRAPHRAPQTPPPEYLYRPTPADRVQPMSTVRKRIARHMRWSVRISPHATAQAEVDMSAIAAQLAHRDAFREATGAPLTYTVFAAAATVRALRDFPILNSSVVGDDIVFKPSINLGVAVALADSDELIVPVVRRAEDLALVGLARAMHDLVIRARSRQLRPDDVQGGTFTLTNPGIFGGITGTPILNQPQVGILGLGAVRKQAVVIEDALAVRSMMALALTFDHRATDGMVAFRFLARVRELLEQPPADWLWTTQSALD